MLALRCARQALACYLAHRGALPPIGGRVELQWDDAGGSVYYEAGTVAAHSIDWSRFAVEYDDGTTEWHERTDFWRFTEKPPPATNMVVVSFGKGTAGSAGGGRALLDAEGAAEHGYDVYDAAYAEATLGHRQQPQPQLLSSSQQKGHAWPQSQLPAARTTKRPRADQPAGGGGTSMPAALMAAAAAANAAAIMARDPATAAVHRAAQGIERHHHQQSSLPATGRSGGGSAADGDSYSDVNASEVARLRSQLASTARALAEREVSLASAQEQIAGLQQDLTVAKSRRNEALLKLELELTRREYDIARGGAKP